MAWHWEVIVWTKDGLAYWRIYASLGLEDLRARLPFISVNDDNQFDKCGIKFPV